MDFIAHKLSDFKTTFWFHENLPKLISIFAFVSGTLSAILFLLENFFPVK